MAEATVARVQKAVESFLDDLDKICLRKMKGDMHRCASKCCDNKDQSVEHVYRCIDDCSRPMVSAQEFVQAEMNKFQDRLQRCVLNCQDQIRDKVGSNVSEDKVAPYRGEFERCVDKCAESHVNLLPVMLKRMRQTLSKDSYDYDLN